MTFRKNIDNKSVKNRNTGYPSLDKTHLQGAKFTELHPPAISVNPYHLIKILNRKRLDRVCFESWYDGSKHTYCELLEDVESAAKSLRMYGLDRGDTITIATPVLYESFVVFVAAVASGINVSLAHFYLGTETLARYAESHGSAMFFSYEQNEEFALAILKGTKKAKYVVNIDYQWLTKDGTIPFHEFFNYGKIICRNEKIKFPLLDSKVRFWLQTSGSTQGVPKDMAFGLKQIFNMLMQAANASDTSIKNDCSTILVQLTPLSMPYVMTMTFANLAAGQNVNIIDGTNREHVTKFFSSIADRSDLVVFGIPSFYASLVELMPEDAALPKEVTLYNGGDHLPDKLRVDLLKCFTAHGSSQIQVCDDYGIGEALCVGSDGKHLSQFDEKGNIRPRARAYRGTKWVLIDENGDEVKYGEKGKILISSKSLCEEYHDDPLATRRAFFDDGTTRWFDTGDYGILDRDGCLTIIGREKNFFIPEGAHDKVNCDTIAHIIEGCGLVKHCCVVVGHQGNFECGIAFVELSSADENRDSAEGKIYRYAKSRLEDFQMPAKIIIIDQMPFMGSGKVDRKQLETIANTE